MVKSESVIAGFDVHFEVTSCSSDVSVAGYAVSIRSDEYDVMISVAVCGIDEKKVLGQERPQGKFVIVRVAMFNGMKRPMTMSETEFKLVTTDGAEYAYSIRAIPDVNGGQRGGDHKEINPGFTVFKSFPFDVPKNINISDLRLKAVGEHNGVPILLPLVVQKVG